MRGHGRDRGRIGLRHTVRMKGTRVQGVSFNVEVMAHAQPECHLYLEATLSHTRLS